MNPKKVASAVICAALMMTATIAPASARRGGVHSPPIRVSGIVTDLQTGIDNPTDGAAYRVTQVRNRRGTFTRMTVWNIDAERGTRFGTHVHEGPCVEDNGAAAGPHWNATGGEVVNPNVEVWLDFKVTRRGKGRAISWINATIPRGEGRSIVIHEMATAPDGAAGARLACFPLTS